MYDKIIILDFGSQTTQLIARRLRELKEYCEILPYNKFPAGDTAVKGVILSGSPFSVHDKEAFSVDLSAVRGKIPMLGICYGAQFLAHTSGGKVEPAGSRQSGNAIFDFIDGNDLLFKGIEQGSQVRMSLSDKITALPANAKKTAGASGETAAYKIDGEKTWGIQFQPEVYETADGMKILSNFLDICGASRTWSPASFIENTVRELKEKIGNDKVILALSGGVDSSVTAVLLHRAIGENFTCVFVDHGLLRKNEFENVLRDYRHLGLNVIGIDARKRFYGKLAGITDPEQKRKIIGASFIDVFDEEAKKIKDVKWLAQGTIYPDIIESLSITGVTVKSHHNVGGLPEKMNLKLIEPLRLLFKDEVRKVGTELEMQPHLINRHPFPGPGLGVRLLGDITEEKIRILQDADDIFISALREWKLYDKVWQAGAILLPIQSVGMMDDKRTYENAVALRAVNSTDAMTADWATLPFDFLAHVSNSIITKVRGVNRVVYDISSKPPATIEWE